jgi:hypothetical protein
MKRQKDREMIQSAVRFPQWLHEQLQKAGGERGMSEEIRRRLELTFAGEGAPTDEITNEVIAEIREIASDLSRYGSWHTDRDAFDVFKAAVNALLSSHQPRGEPNPDTTAHLRAVYGEKTSADIGLILAHAAIFAYRKERTGGLTGPARTGLDDYVERLASPAGPSRRGRARSD